MAATPAFGFSVRPELLGAIGAGIEPPPLAREVQKTLIIRGRVPGAAEVFTPMTIRALLRGKEAAGRYRPQKTGGRRSSQPPRLPGGSMQLMRCGCSAAGSMVAVRVDLGAKAPGLSFAMA